MKAEHIKVWLDEIQRKEKAARENPGRVADPGAGHKWKIFIKLIQAVWDRGEIPEQMSWMIIDRPTRPLLEGSGESHCVPTGQH